jgi:hypothetical protein
VAKKRALLVGMDFFLVTEMKKEHEILYCNTKLHHTGYDIFVSKIQSNIIAKIHPFLLLHNNPSLKNAAVDGLKNYFSEYFTLE